MTNAGEKLLRSAKQAKEAIEPPTDEERRVIEAAELIKAYMRRELIVDKCRLAPCMGCISCRAVDLERGLDSLIGMF